MHQDSKHLILGPKELRELQNYVSNIDVAITLCIHFQELKLTTRELFLNEKAKLQRCFAGGNNDMRRILSQQEKQALKIISQIGKDATTKVSKHCELGHRFLHTFEKNYEIYR